MVLSTVTWFVVDFCCGHAQNTCDLGRGVGVRPRSLWAGLLGGGSHTDTPTYLVPFLILLNVNTLDTVNTIIKTLITLCVFWT